VPASLQEARRRWAELLRRLLEVDPLRCPRCGQEMYLVAFITQPELIERILTTCGAPPRDRAVRGLRCGTGSRPPHRGSLAVR